MININPTRRSSSRERREEAIRGEFFDGVVQYEVEKQDYVYKVPTFYYDNLSMNAAFTASTKRVRNYLPHPDMRPVEILPGRCLVTFTAFEYRKTDLGPYNEFSIGVLIEFDKRPVPVVGALKNILKREFTLFVWHLPVTTEIARVGGVEYYGYPKFIADIEFTRSEDKLRCDVSEEGSKILSMEAKMLPAEPGKRLRYITYSLNSGSPMVTNICVNPLQFAQSRDSDATRLEFGSDHPIAKELQGINLGDTPNLYQYSPNNEAILFAGRNLMDV